MNNNNGALNFDAYIETTDFKRQIDEMEKRIVGLTNTTTKEADKMDSTFRKVGAAIGTYFSLQALKQFGGEVINVRGEFQKLEAVLTNTLGSSSKAKAAMDMLSDFGATTPFQVNELTASFVKLANQGFTPTRDELVKLGDLASSTGKPFDQLAEAIIDAQTGENERLKEFGIRASKEGDKITYTFKEQSTTVDNSAESIRNYILSLGDMEGVAGANEKIAATLTGQISNLEDAWTQMLNEIGQSNEGIISEGIAGVASLVEHYDKILDIITVLVATYGAYKAAVIAVTVAKQVSIATTSGLTAAETLHYGALVLAEKAQALLNKTMLANPYVLAATLLVGLITSVALYSKSATAAEKAQTALNEALDEAEKSAAAEIAKVQTLTTIIKSETASRNDKNKALRELIALSPEHLSGLTEEAIKTGEATKAIDAYIESKRKQIQLDALNKELEESIKRENDAKAGKNEIGWFKKGLFGFAAAEGGIDYAETVEAANKELNDQALKDEKAVQDAIKKKIESILAAGNDKSEEKVTRSYTTVGEKIDEITNKITSLEAKRKDMNSADTAGIAKINKEIDELNKKKNALEGKSSGTSSDKSVVSGSLDYWEKVRSDAQKSLSALSTKDANFAQKQTSLLATIKKAEDNIGAIERGQSSFNEQLDYKRSQYTKYYKWVTQVGKEAANTEFKDLISEGSSFVEYLDRQIAELEAKRDAGTLTGDEGNNLISLNEARDEATGTKSAIDTFRDELSAAKEEASSLVEYLDLLKKKKDELKDDNTDLGLDKKNVIEDEATNTEYDIKDQSLRLLSDYESNNARIKQMQAQLNADLAVLNKAYLESKSADERAEIEASMELLKQSLSTTGLELKESLGFDVLFKNLDTACTAELKKMRDSLKNAINSEDFQKANAEDQKALFEAYDQINVMLSEQKPIFGDLAEAVREYSEAQKELKDAQDEYNEAVKNGTEAEKAAAGQKVTTAQGKVQSTKTNLDATSENTIKKINAVSSAIRDLSDVSMSSLGSAIGTLIEAFAASGSKIGMIIAAVLSLLDEIGKVGLDGLIEAVLASVANALVGIGKGIANIVANVFTLGGAGDLFSSESIEEEIERLTNSNKDLEAAVDELTEVMEATAGQAATDEYQKAQERLDQSIANQAKLLKDAAGDWSNGFLGIGGTGSANKHINEVMGVDDWGRISDLVGQTVKSATDLWSLTPEQMASIRREATDLWSKIKQGSSDGYQDLSEYMEAYADYYKELIDLQNAYNETLTGISFDSARDGLRELVKDTDLTLEDATKKFKDYMRDAVLSVIIDASLKQRIQTWYDQFAEAMSDGELTGGEEAALQSAYEKMYNDAVAMREAAYKAAGIEVENTDDTETTSEDPLTGSVQSLSEETGSTVAGQITIMRIIGAEQLERVKAAVEILASIEYNTSFLTHLTKLDRIIELLEDSGSDTSLRSKGL